MWDYSDEYYTSADKVKDCVERVTIDKSWKILCPFDTIKVNLLNIYLKVRNYNVTYLKDGEVNTDYKPEDYDIIITNPWRNFTKLYSDYFDRCERFIAILSWTILLYIERKTYTPGKEGWD